MNETIIEVYARRDMRTQYGILKVGFTIKVWIIKSQYKKLKSTEKKKWTLVKMNRYTHRWFR